MFKKPKHEETEAEQLLFDVKQGLPDITDRSTKKINLTPNLTAMMTAHGKTKASLHRFKIIQSPECICTEGDQTVDHLIYDCGKLEKERGKLIAHVSREDN